MKLSLIIQYFLLKLTIQISFSFYRENFTSLTHSNIHSKLFENKIQTIIKIGTPEISIPLNIKTQEYTLSIVSSSTKIKEEKIPLFNEKNSKSLRLFYLDPDDYLNEDFTYGSLGKETFYFGKENIKLEEITFLLAFGLNVIESGVLGLGLFYKNFNIRFANLIDQLKERKIINEKVFYFNFFDNDNGELIIGNYPYENKSLFLEKKDFESFSVYINNTKQQKYNFLFDTVYFNNEEIESEIIGDVFIESGMIKVDNVYFKKIEDSFFKNYLDKNICEKVHLFNGNFSFVCDKKVNIKKFGAIKLKIRRFNFILEGKDVFYEFENKFYFLIYYGDYNQNWIIGKPFFKKYTFVFEPDKKTIGIYKNKIGKTNFHILIVIFLFIIIIGLISFIFIFIRRKKIKSKALELNDEEFIYEKQDSKENMYKKAFGF